MNSLLLCAVLVGAAPEAPEVQRFYPDAAQSEFIPIMDEILDLVVAVTRFITIATWILLIGIPLQVYLLWRIEHHLRACLPVAIKRLPPQPPTK